MITQFMRGLVLLLAVSVTACSGGIASSGVRQVTPLPSQAATATAQPTPTLTASPLVEVTPTTRLEATVAAVTQAAGSKRSTGSNTFALDTPTPQANKLEPGEARAIALATDTGLVPTLSARMTFAEQPVSIQFDEFYSGFSLRTGLVLSDKLKSLDGQQVVMEGYIAPPLKPRLDFFVLTRIQLAFCPFCSTDVEWPDDIALIYLPEQRILSSEFPVRITGQMEVGSSVDAETGMVSLVRIYAENLEILH